MVPMRKIYIYNDKGVFTKHLPQLKKWAGKIFNCKSIYEINSKTIISKNILTNKDVLIMPGGHARFYSEKLNGLGCSNIRDFIKDGGLFIGICGGSYFASTKVDFTGEGLRIETDQSSNEDLNIFQATAKGTIKELAPLFKENSETNTFVEILSDNSIYEVYYNGGPCFIPSNEEHFSALFSYKKTQQLAAVKKKYYQGYIYLFGFHPELSQNESLNVKITEDID